MKLVVSSRAHCREVGQIAPHHVLPEGSFGPLQVGHASKNEAAWPGVGVQRELDWNHQKHNDNHNKLILETQLYDLYSESEISNV